VINKRQQNCDIQEVVTATDKGGIPAIDRRWQDCDRQNLAWKARRETECAIQDRRHT